MKRLFRFQTNEGRGCQTSGHFNRLTSGGGRFDIIDYDPDEGACSCSIHNSFYEFYTRWTGLGMDVRWGFYTIEQAIRYAGSGCIAKLFQSSDVQCVVIDVGDEHYFGAPTQCVYVHEVAQYREIVRSIDELRMLITDYRQSPTVDFPRFTPIVHPAYAVF